MLVILWWRRVLKSYISQVKGKGNNRSFIALLRKR
jgi:hypothetical protein